MPMVMLPESDDEDRPVCTVRDPLLDADAAPVTRLKEPELPPVVLPVRICSSPEDPAADASAVDSIKRPLHPLAPPPVSKDICPPIAVSSVEPA